MSTDDHPHLSTDDHPHLPSEVSDDIGFFDRFAGWAARFASRAPFFAFCLLLVVLWLAQGIVVMLAKGDLHTFLDDKYQLEINTTTTIITFLMVALLQNSQTRGDQALQHKLNAVADGLADLMEALSDQVGERKVQLERDVRELKDAVGLEDRESTTHDGDGAGARRSGASSSRSSNASNRSNGKDALSRR